MTMRELAGLANVSVSTVSKAFHGGPDISAETRERIFALARQHGCYGRFFRGKYPRKVIAIICPELGSAHYIDYVERLKNAIEADGGIAVVASYQFDEAYQAELVEYFASYLQVDGIFVIHLKCELKKGYDVPIVALASREQELDSVNADIGAALAEALAELRRLGHTSVTFVGESLTAGKQQQFEELVQADAQLQGTVIVSEERFEKAGADGVRRLLEQAPECTALVCAYDDIALGAIRALTQRGLRVPQDISVMGIDNIVHSAYAQTALTTIGCDMDGMCAAAWRIMAHKLKNRYYKNRQSIVLPGRLILRDTVGKAPEKRG
ncbi:MAG: LacI family DNA-binding transcriptional regulator [Oscillospiraceae bacterium]|nr:LacI family DNA-binding transcriptional regulator [Oscillospiraceae bacterium]